MRTCPKDVIIPVIVIPGIMGSRLQKANDQSKVWDPDDSFFMGTNYALNAGSVVGPDIFRVRQNRNVMSAAAKRKSLMIGGSSFNKDYLIPIEYSPNKDSISDAPTEFWGSQIERNWGSVAWGFYGDLLRNLESDKEFIASEVKKVNPLFNLVEMPVFGLGYNWTQSNDDSGKYAAEKIAEWTEKARQRAAELNAQCPGSLVITHSMGGFVARSAATLHGAEGDIFSVLHTVMPTDGAAAAYKRFHFGFENPDFSIFSPKKGLGEFASYVVLGRQGALVTALLGHMPGGQELLPNKRYKDNQGNSKWLIIHHPEKSTVGGWIWGGSEPHLELPESNPYAEIYCREDRMYRAANPEWLFPEGMENMSPDVNAFDYFRDVNAKAESYHDRVIAAGDYHSVTYLCYSEDDTLSTYDRIEWQSDKFMNRELSEDDLSGDRTDDYRREHLMFGDESDKEISGGWFGVDFKIKSPAGAGDLTVPASAGSFANLPDSRKTGHSPGYSHDGVLTTEVGLSWVKDTMVEVFGECSLY